jgi:glucosamine 6-phosphate synthetase-like amidotransferase/phosphosugar isomerase protein
VPHEEDCFYKMQEAYKAEEGRVESKIGVLHSRYASTKGKIKESLAHPHYDDKNRIIVFHNGFIANYEDLQK